MPPAACVAPTTIPSLDALLAALAQAGYSNTRSRRAVLMAICEAGGQASGAELLALGRAHHPALGLVTIYRTLDLLLSLGLVRKLHLDEGCHTYALSMIGPHGEARGSDRHDHGHHVICRDCGRAVEFEGCDLDVVVASWKRRPASACRNTGWKCSASAPHVGRANRRINESRINELTGDEGCHAN